MPITPIKPKRLKKGGVIGVVAPASPVTSHEKIHHAVRFLERLGYQVKFGKHVFKSCGYLAGTDEERAEDLNDMFADTGVDAIFCLRGGYGTPRLLSRLNYPLIRRHPKILAGFSDITALSLALYRKIGLITFSAPMLASDFTSPDDFTQANFWPLITEKSKGYALQNYPGHPVMTLATGTADGVLLGGNFSLINTLFGTGYCPQLGASILLLEDVGEEPYRVDRMFSQLFNSGVLSKLKGMILGQFSDSDPDDDEPTFSMDDVLRHYSSSLSQGAPVIGNFTYGHIRHKLTLPLGAPLRLSVTSRSVKCVLTEHVTE